MKKSSALKTATDEPVKALGSGRRLESEVKMRSSAEAYLRGSADVRLFIIYFCVCLL